MKRYAGDLIHDLRERNLLPVALLLIAAIVAVPVFLLKPSSDAAEVASAPPVVSETATEIDADLLEPGEPRASDLDSFDKKNPFARPGGLKREQADGGGSDSGSAPSGGDSTPSGGGALGPADEGVPSPAPDADPEPAGTHLVYTLDLTFEGPRGERRYRNLEELRMLPSPSTPLLVFEGIGKEGNAAVFLVDATVKLLEGEGSCGDEPREQCARLSLGPGAQQAFMDEQGRRYLIRVDQIRERRVAGAPPAAAPPQGEISSPRKAAERTAPASQAGERTEGETLP